MDEQALSEFEGLFSIIGRPHAKDPGAESAASPDSNRHQGRRIVGWRCQQDRHGQGIATAARQGSRQTEGASRGKNVQPGEPKAQRTAEAALPTARLCSWTNWTFVNQSCGGHRGRCELPEKLCLHLPAYRKSGRLVSCQGRAANCRARVSTSAVTAISRP